MSFIWMVGQRKFKSLEVSNDDEKSDEQEK